MTNSADLCRENGWVVGTQLIGKDDLIGGVTIVIELTAIGREKVLARSIRHDGVPIVQPRETAWDLNHRGWQVYVPPFTTADAVAALDALGDNTDAEVQHHNADRILRKAAHPDVAAAYSRVICRTSNWWYA